MQIEDTPIEGLKIIRLNLYGDDRGFFVGLHTTPITDKQLNFIEKNFFNIDEV